MTSSWAGKKVFVAGHRGLVGSALCRALDTATEEVSVLTQTSSDLDLRDARAVDAFFDDEKPQFVLLAAAKVGGIAANNDYPADFIRDNLQIQTNVIDAAWRNNVEKLLFLGSLVHLPNMPHSPCEKSTC